jgi:hypothetical protein
MTTPRPDYLQQEKGKRASRAVAVIGGTLEPGEHVLAVARVNSSVSRRWARILDFAGLFQRYYYLALTERRVILCGLSFWTGRPTAVRVAAPRDQVRVTGYRPGAGAALNSFWLACPGRTRPLRLGVSRFWEREANSILAALGVADAG